MVIVLLIFPDDSNVKPELRTSALERNQWVFHEPYQLGCSFSPKARGVRGDWMLARAGDEPVGGR